MRIKNTIKNSLYSVISYLLLAALAIIVRKVFLRTLSVELLGYEGLFGNVFAILALADLGIETAIYYRMFPAIAKEEHDEINRIMSVYQYLYRIVGIIVLVVGILICPFIRFIIKGNNYQWGYVYAIYFFQLIMTLSSYFLAYKRIMFTVSQREYECTKTDTAVSFAFSALRLVSLLVFKSYFLYLTCNLGSNLISNIIISKKVNKSFEYYQKCKKATISDVKALNFGKDIKNNLFQKVCGTIYGSTDNIVISILLGITQVGLLTNYLLISGYVTSFLTRMLKPFQMSIGNYVYSNDRELGYHLFRMFDFISFCVASTVVCCYYCLFNPTIELLFGNEYLLGQGFVLAFCINQYILWNHQFLSYFRYSFGKYELDRFPIFIAAVINIVLSIALSKPLGMAGVMLGTAVGHLGFWVGRVYVVYTVYIDEKASSYLLRQIIRLICCVGEVGATAFLCRNFTVSITGIVLRLSLSVLFPCAINILLFSGTNEMKTVLLYANKVKETIIKRGEN